MTSYWEALHDQSGNLSTEYVTSNFCMVAFANWLQSTPTKFVYVNDTSTDMFCFRVYIVVKTLLNVHVLLMVVEMLDGQALSSCSNM